MNVEEFKRKRSGSTCLGTPTSIQKRTPFDPDQNLQFRIAKNPPSGFKYEVKKTPVFRVDFKELSQNFHGRKITEDDLCRSTPAQLFKEWLSSKDKAIGLQVGLESFSPGAMQMMVDYCTARLPSLLSHPGGSYVLQRLLHLDPTQRMAKSILEYTLRHMKSTLGNEYSSRVIESLFSAMPECITSLMTIFKQNLPQLLNNFPTVFVFASGIINCPDEELKDLITMNLLSSISLMKSKYFKRLIVTFVQSCSNEKMVNLSTLLHFQENLPFYFKDKYSIQVFAAFYSRGCADAVCSLENAIKEDFSTTLQHKYFMPFIEFIVVKETPKSILKALLSTLLNYSQYFGPHLNLDTSLFQQYSKIACTLQMRVNKGINTQAYFDDADQNNIESIHCRP